MDLIRQQKNKMEKKKKNSRIVNLREVFVCAQTHRVITECGFFNSSFDLLYTFKPILTLHSDCVFACVCVCACVFAVVYVAQAMVVEIKATHFDIVCIVGTKALEI